MPTEDRLYLSDELNDLASESKTEGKAEAVLDLLRGRRIDVPDRVQRVILAEKDRAVLGIYLLRAATADTAAAVIKPINGFPPNGHGPGKH